MIEFYEIVEIHAWQDRCSASTQVFSVPFREETAAFRFRVESAEEMLSGTVRTSEEDICEIYPLLPLSERYFDGSVHRRAVITSDDEIVVISLIFHHLEE